MQNLTIFTPTYNRASTLDRLYKSLIKIKKIDFVWLIVDDGSTDNTKELIDKFKTENKININYVYQENGGKMKAFNKAIDICNSNYFMTIDSDDMIYDKFTDNFFADTSKIKDIENVAGIVYLTIDMNGENKIIGSKMPDDTICKFYDIYNKYGVTGDKCIVWKANILKQYHYPIIEGEKFIPDAYLMNDVSNKYNFMTINHIGTMVEYQTDGYSANYFQLVKRNPKGNRLYFKQLYQIKKSWYNVYGYILFSIYAKYKFTDILREHSNKIMVIVLYIPTLLISIFK